MSEQIQQIAEQVDNPNENVNTEDPISVLLKSKYESFKNEDDFKEKLNSDFFFNAGQDALNNLLNNENNLDYKKALETTTKKDWYINVRDKNGNFIDEFKDIGNKINDFVAYCDVNAKNANGKRCIAKAGIRQNAWIKNVLQYLVNVKEQEGNVYDGVAYGVMRAIMYFNKPSEVFPILSKKHQEYIAEYFKINCENFDKELKSILDELFVQDELLHPEKADGDQQSTQNPNITSIYTSLIYEIKSEWEDFDISFYENNQNVILTGAPGTGKTF